MKQFKQKKELLWLVQHARPAMVGIVLLSLCACLLSGFSIAFALLMKQLIDSAVQHDLTGFGRCALLYLGMLLFQSALVLLVNIRSEKLYNWLEHQLEASVFETLLRMEHGSFSAYPTGALMSHITSDVGTVINSILNLLPGLLSLLVKLVGAAALLIVWDRRFAFVLLVGGGAMMGAATLLRRKLKQMQREVRAEEDKAWSFLAEMFRSELVLKVFSVQKRAVERLHEQLDQLQKVRFRQVVFSNVCNRGFNLGMNLGYLFGLLWCSVGLLHGTITYGTLTAVLDLVGQLQAPVSQIGSYVQQYASLCASVDRLMALEQQPAELQDRLNEQADRALYAGTESIRAQGLTFAYAMGKPVYTQASLQIGKGETVAFVGRSGIGKSTFLKLLLALYPPAGGEIWLQGADGTQTPVTVNTRSLFAYVPQENGLLSGSIWECVVLLKKAQELTPEEKSRVQQACRTACAEEFILTLPQGYDTILGENGAGLSEGQMQRLAVARALYTQAPILLLDEATSALDEATEARLLANLQADSAQKTVLIVTHRKAALALCDRVFEVKNGQFQQVETR